MLPSIAPLGISNAALDVLRQALDFAVAVRRQNRAQGPAEASDLVHLGLLSVALKLVTPDPEVLEEASEGQGLLRLLTLAKDMLREETRVQGARSDGSGRPDLEIADLLRRARYLPMNGRPAASDGTPSDLFMSLKEAS